MCGEVGILYPFSGDWGYGPTAQVGFIDGLGSPPLQKVVFVLVMICIFY
jgi:hypothetical protein